MQHVSLTPFGRQPISAAALTRLRDRERPPALPRIDKRCLLADLATARAEFGLSDRNLAVLDALLSFLPVRELDASKHLVVFPSNSALSSRTHGMPESTLRRHLARLVEAGLIRRQDSPNGKRFVRRDNSGVPSEVFGFDLTPLLLRSREISDAAAATADAARRLRAAREALVLRLRDASKLVDIGSRTGLPGDWGALDARLAPLRGALRRRMDAGTLEQLGEQAGDILRALWAMHDLGTPKMIGSAAHSGCHPSESEKEPPDSDEGNEQIEADDNAREPTMPIALVLKACPDVVTYAENGIESWRDLIKTGARLCPMMGITPDVWAQACREMGPAGAAVTVCALLQRFDRIAKPGAYLRALSAKAANRGFSPGSMVLALLRDDTLRKQS